MIDGSHRAGSREPRDFRRIAQRRRQQNARNPVLSHQLGFRNSRDTDPARSVRDLTLHDLDTLMHLGMRAMLFAGFLNRLSHASQVSFKKVGIKKQRGSRNLIFCEHRSIMQEFLPRSALPMDIAELLGRCWHCRRGPSSSINDYCKSESKNRPPDCRGVVI